MRRFGRRAASIAASVGALAILVPITAGPASAAPLSAFERCDIICDPGPFPSPDPFPWPWPDFPAPTPLPIPEDRIPQW